MSALLVALLVGGAQAAPLADEFARGEGGYSKMRLQMHATDPERLEPLLGRAAASQGCIRIAATLNVFIDRHGLLDADYYRSGPHWVLRADREPTPTPGRWLVVVDTNRTARPPWARAR